MICGTRFPTIWASTRLAETFTWAFRLERVDLLNLRLGFGVLWRTVMAAPLPVTLRYVGCVAYSAASGELEHGFIHTAPRARSR
jgi:hypothetical protein